MRWIDNLIHPQGIKKQNTIEEIKVLEEFMQIAQSKDISPEESNKNLEEGLIEIKENGYHSSNGILITEDGYFLTALHCLEDLVNKREVKIYTKENKRYAFEKICSSIPKEDICLAKADIQKRCIARRYSLYTGEVKKEFILLLTRKNEMLYKNFGEILRGWNPHKLKKLNGEKVHYLNHFETTNITKKGDSGGIIINPNSQLIGMACGGGSFITNCVKIGYRLELIKNYKEKILTNQSPQP